MNNNKDMTYLSNYVFFGDLLQDKNEIIRFKVCNCNESELGKMRPAQFRSRSDPQFRSAVPNSIQGCPQFRSQKKKP